MNVRSESKTTRLRLHVGNRDGWICYRCRQAGKPLDQCRIIPALRHPHRLSATLEHVLPEGVTLAQWVAQGHDPFDPRYATVSHKACNLSAGASLGGQRTHNRRIATTITRTELTW